MKECEVKRGQYVRHGETGETHIGERVLPGHTSNELRVSVKPPAINPPDWKLRRAATNRLTGILLVLWISCGFASGQGRLQSFTVQNASGVIAGTVKDPSGAFVSRAVVTLESSVAQRTAITNDAGSFSFSAVAQGRYRITVSASGFAPWTSADVTVFPGENTPVIVDAALQLAPAIERVTVSLPPRELAAEQLKAEEKQRLFGVFPNYFVTYEPNAAPLTAGQKFQLGLKTFLDPVTIASSGVLAGVEQARNSDPTYGQGTEGYAKRFGADYADRVDSVLVGRVLMQSIFHQDPRYFYKGTGSFWSRALYAVGTAFVRKGDDGHWQPAYSDVLGGMASYGISSLYRPGTSLPGRRLFDTVLLNFADTAAEDLMQEFAARKLTTHVPSTSGAVTAPILTAGTPVSLISVEDLSSKMPRDSGATEFTLARDLRVDGSIVAKAGAPAFGRVEYVSQEAAGARAIHLKFERFRLVIGNVWVPLRGTQTHGGDSPVQYHRLENSGRIVIELYVDKDTVLTPVR